MGCGCGRSSGSSVAPVNIVESNVESDSAGYISPAPEPNIAKFAPIYTHEHAPVAENNNMLVALANLAKARTSGSGLQLRGIPMLSKKTVATPKNDSSGASETVALAQQNSIPVAEPTRKYSILDVIKDTLTGNAKYTEETMAQKRLQVCNTCPNQVAGACIKCGCIVKLKVKYEESSCPINKW